MINLFIPVVILIASSLAFLLFKGVRRNLFIYIILLSISFCILVYFMRLPFSSTQTEILSAGLSAHKTGVLIELSSVTSVFSIILLIASAVILLRLIMSSDDDSKKPAILAMMTSFALLALQSVEFLYFIIFIFMQFFLLIIYSNASTLKNAFSVVRFTTGIFVSFIFSIIALGSMAAIFGSVNISIMTENHLLQALDGWPILMMFSFALAFSAFLGLFPMNIFTYDYLSAANDCEKSIFVMFIVFPSLTYLLKYFTAGDFMFSSVKLAFIISVISFALSVFAIFGRKNIKDAKPHIIFAVISETLSVLLYQLLNKSPVDFILLASNTFMLVLMLLSLEILSADSYEGMRGSFMKNPFAVLAFMISSFSISFIPPSLGFVTKYSVISKMVFNGDYFLSSLIVVSFAMETFIFLKILFSMFLTDKTEQISSEKSNPFAVYLFIAGAVALILGYSSMGYFSKMSLSGYREMHESVRSAIQKSISEEEKPIKLKQFIIE